MSRREDDHLSSSDVVGSGQSRSAVLATFRLVSIMPSVALADNLPGRFPRRLNSARGSSLSSVRPSSALRFRLPVPVGTCVPTGPGISWRHPRNDFSAINSSLIDRMTIPRVSPLRLADEPGTTPSTRHWPEAFLPNVTPIPVTSRTSPVPTSSPRSRSIDICASRRTATICRVALAAT